MTRTLLVNGEEAPEVAAQFSAAKESLALAGVEVAHYDGVIPNPTVESISAGAALARQFGAQSAVGLGGGPAMGSAKAIAVEATHDGSPWDYLFYIEAPTEATPPITAVSTTPGTGSYVTQVAVITNPEARDKSAIYYPHAFPKMSIVDPELMLNVPRQVTACTGFDLFRHAFETTIHPNWSPLLECFAWEAIGRVVASQHQVLADGSNLDTRESMAWADTLAGCSIASAGVTLPIVNDRELTLTGTLMYQQSDYVQAVEWLAAGAVKAAPLITKHFPFEAYAEAYRFIDQNSSACLKVMIDL